MLEFGLFVFCFLAGLFASKIGLKRGPKYRCPWPECGVQAPDNCLRQAYGGEMISKREKCSFCEHWILFNDHINKYQRVD